MNQQEFQKLSNDLQSLARLIPLNWGKVQNDRTDSNINMFQIASFQELENEIATLSENTKNYFRRRWFLWKSAQCDEFIFCSNKNVSANPNPRDQSYDIEFNRNRNLQFDIKGTVIPRDFRDNVNSVVQQPENLVQFFYEMQSKGVRNNIQNRLFLVHHSFINQEREMYLRCLWNFKFELFKNYSNKISEQSKFIKYKNVKSDIIFIFENKDKSISYSFCAVN